MDKISFFLITVMGSLLLSTNNIIAQNNLYNLEIQITGFKSNKGKVLLQLFDKKELSISKKTATIKNNSCRVIITELKAGKYLIRYFHDENDNDNLDTNWFGIPVEGYGFSNNAESMFGIPSIDDRLFSINSNKKIFLEIKY